MNDDIMDDLKEKMIHNAFIPEERMYQFRTEVPAATLRGTESTDDFEDTVREEVRQLERTANVVTGIHVDAGTVQVAILLGHDVDVDLIQRLIEDVQHRIHEQAYDYSEDDA